MIERNTVLQVNPSVDVYKIGDDRLEFYYITTRRRITLEVSTAVVDLVNALDGITPLCQIGDSLSLDIEDSNVQAFLSFLLEKKIILVPAEEKLCSKVLESKDLERYDRQLSYLNTWFPDSAYDLQKKLGSVKVLVFGLGAIGSGIALQLAMAGVRHFILVDKDIVTADNIERHFTFRRSDIGKPKVQAVSQMLSEVDSKVKCSTFQSLIDYNTDLSELLAQADFIINTLDEPYIGFTSMKIGRACYYLNKPLYVGGGFDAHLMSTGELIVPNETPCVDCYTAYFTDTLKDWKPKYNVDAISSEEFSDSIFEVGGLSSMSLFSISYAVIVIINYLCTGDALYSKGRGELLFDSLHVNYLNVPRNPNCKICGRN